MSLDGPQGGVPLYARFSRRLKGIFFDWLIAISVIFAAIFVAVTVQNDNFSRWLGILVVVALLLYEPLLVPTTGGTLGHWLTNLRVVDERTGGNVSVLKACARVLIKGVLGWYSFVVLAATRRNQAIHDLLTRSTVQIRDPAKARAGQYIMERTDLSEPGMPSRLRRLVVIVIWLALAFCGLMAVSTGIVAAGMLSASCIDRNVCSGAERILTLATGLALVAMTALIIVFGWKGRLFGARRG